MKKDSTTTSIRIHPQLVADAKAAGLNISDVARRALLAKLDRELTAMDLRAIHKATVRMYQASVGEGREKDAYRWRALATKLHRMIQTHVAKD